MVKVDVEEDQWRRGRMREGCCCCRKQVAVLGIYLFSATKQDKVGPSLQLCCLHIQIAVHTLQRNWIFRLVRYLMVNTRPFKCIPSIFHNNPAY